MVFVWSPVGTYSYLTLQMPSVETATSVGNVSELHSQEMLGANLFLYIEVLRNRKSAVGIVTIYGLGGQGNGV
jgi:hypothetical protein